MTAPLVSLVIPCYNAAPWIAETLQSCLAQTYRPLEIIVVDDGSTDTSPTVAAATLQTASIPYRCLSIPNGGASRARNVGWQAARGDWIQFLDADDLLVADKIAIQVTAVNNDTAVVYGAWQRYGQSAGAWQPLGAVVAPALVDPPADVLRDGSFIQLGAALFRRDWLARVGGFDECIGIIQDVNLLLRIALAGGTFQPCPSAAPLAYYRQLDGSLSRRSAREFGRDLLTNARTLHDWLLQADRLTEARRQVLIASYAHIARASFRVDPETFEAAYGALTELAPNGRYVPTAPRSLAVLTQLVGYRRAETVAARYRDLKAWLRR